MPVRKDEQGRRYVQVEAEVPGAPEQVWDAIATGHGISSWFVPTELEEREGGRVVSHFSPDGTMDAVATVAVWDPPRRMVATGKNDPNGPDIASEWTVETRAGGTCLVRVVHRWFADSDDWDNQLEQAESGWPSFFRILRLYLAHFAGQGGVAFQVMGHTPLAVPDAWRALERTLGIPDVAEGGRVASSSAPVSFAGHVERRTGADAPDMLVRLDSPAPGLIHAFAMAMGGTTIVPVRVFFYGDGAPAMAAREEPKWQAAVAGLAQAVS